MTTAAEAREARGIVETALAGAGWPFTRQLSLWMDTLVTIEEGAAAGATAKASPREKVVHRGHRQPPGLTARCNALSSKFVQCLNRRTRAELELQHPTIEPARRRHLEARLVALYVEQDQLEAQMTRLAERLEAEA